MDRRIAVIAGFGVLIVVLVLAVVLPRSGGDSEEQPSLANLKAKPVVKGSDKSPPTSLETDDVKVGTGPAAKAGDKVSVQYVGTLFDSGEEFDSSWDRGEPFQFTLGSGQVIKGWDEGVAGMKAGGRRKLVIPPDLGYGETGSPPKIPANATLVFVVDLVSIDK